MAPAKKTRKPAKNVQQKSASLHKTKRTASTSRSQRKPQQSEGPLTAQQKKVLRDTWSELYSPANRMKLGIDIFIRLFTTDPESQKLFRSFKDESNLEELAKKPKLKAHGFRVVSSVNNLIQNLDTPDIFVEMVKNLARSHHGHNVTKANFQELGPILLTIFGEHMGDRFTDEAKATWLAAYTFIVESIWGEYDVIEEENK